MRSAVPFLLAAVLLAAPSPGGAQSDLDPRVSRLFAEISEDRLAVLLERLVSFETRNTGAVLAGVSIDDYVFGVSAIGADGHESLVSAYVNPPRPNITIQTAP